MLRHEPGAEHQYSNYGYVLLGRLIEAVSGQSYYDYVHDRIYEPAGMTHTGSLPEVDGTARQMMWRPARKQFTQAMIIEDVIGALELKMCST